MSKVKLKKCDCPSKHTGKKKKSRAVKKTFFFPEPAKNETKPVKTDIVPPTDNQQFSSNWKNLLKVRAVRVSEGCLR